MLGCAVIIPSLQKEVMYKLNNNSCSYMAESIAIIKAMDLSLDEGWASINICSDSLSVLTKIKSDFSYVSFHQIQSLSYYVRFII